MTRSNTSTHSHTNNMHCCIFPRSTLSPLELNPSMDMFLMARRMQSRLKHAYSRLALRRPYSSGFRQPSEAAPLKRSATNTRCKPNNLPSPFQVSSDEYTRQNVSQQTLQAVSSLDYQQQYMQIDNLMQDQSVQCHAALNHQHRAASSSFTLSVDVKSSTFSNALTVFNTSHASPPKNLQTDCNGISNSLFQVAVGQRMWTRPTHSSNASNIGNRVVAVDSIETAKDADMVSAGMVKASGCQMASSLVDEIPLSKSAGLLFPKTVFDVSAATSKDTPNAALQSSVFCVDSLMPSCLHDNIASGKIIGDHTVPSCISSSANSHNTSLPSFAACFEPMVSTLPTTAPRSLSAFKSPSPQSHSRYSPTRYSTFEMAAALSLSSLGHSIAQPLFACGNSGAEVNNLARCTPLLESSTPSSALSDLSLSPESARSVTTRAASDEYRPLILNNISPSDSYITATPRSPIQLQMPSYSNMHVRVGQPMQV
ncbi:hypothetical protein O5D80_006529 [Batrachochytrium dendrobatidis]|nr:hypothetical protein O5D80_006529 [Batrachochytrium dendrobatidis]